MLATAKAMGITTFQESDRFGLALTLGGGEVKLLELTAAYATFANEGQRVTPRAILAVQDTQDKGRSWQVEDATEDAPEAVSPQIAYLVTSILSDDIARIPAFGEDSVLNLTRPAAAKTGTTTDFRDNWTLGYTPDLAVGVWAGNANNAPMYRVTGITGAGPIWNDFMELAHRGTPARAFERPEGIVEKEICDASGLLPTELCPRVRTEIFIQGTQPRAQDNSYQRLAVDAPTNHLWAENCRGPRVERIFRIYPPDAQDWAKKKGLATAPELDCQGRPVVSSFNDATVGAGYKASSAEKPAPPANLNRQPIEVISPPHNSLYETSPQIPAESQRIEVSARLNQSLRLKELTLYIDGAPVGTFSGVPYRALWQLQTGEHTAQAVGITTDGSRVESEAVRFTVNRAE
jgi:membrane carboxypeptidase/penicillin-binding protein PbpC